MYFLMRRWSIGRAAALIAAFAYAASPKIIAHMGVGHVTLVEAWAWVPLVIGWRSASSSRTGKPNALLSGVALALCLLADARMAVYAVVLLVLYVLIMQAATQTRTWLDRAVGLLLVVAIVALALSAAAWLPALTLTDGTARSNLSRTGSGHVVVGCGRICWARSSPIAAARRNARRTVGLVVLILAARRREVEWQRGDA